MGIYSGIDGVVRKVTQPCVGVNGTVHTLTHGFNGVEGLRRQFFGLLEDVEAVEVRAYSLRLSDYGAGTISNGQPIGISEVSPYGSVSISEESISVSCNTRGKWLDVYGRFIAIFENGREVYLNSLSESLAKYGATISFPVSYYQRMDCTEGGYFLYCCGQILYNSYVNNSVSGTKTLTELTVDYGCVGAGVLSGAGSATTRMTFNSTINIDGRDVPVRVVSNLT